VRLCESIPPSISAYFPVSHETHDLLKDAPTAAEKVPAPHGKHVDTDVAPTAEEYLHALQLAHGTSPNTNLYLPSTQLTHVPLTKTCLCSCKQAEAWNSKHNPSPDWALYVPTTQAEHDPKMPLYPAGHSDAQSLSELLPAAVFS